MEIVKDLRDDDNPPLMLVLLKISLLSCRLQAQIEGVEGGLIVWKGWADHLDYLLQSSEGSCLKVRPERLGECNSHLRKRM